jgi:DNA-binding transcriptional regulator YbjK
MDPRRQLIADAALRVIGEEGIRALTHHRVDDAAGLARGSSSYYCRRRVDLLELALRRLYVRDEADLRAAVERAGEAPTPSAVRDTIAELVHGWLGGEARTRSIARIELFMAASHEAELQPLLSEQFASLREMALPLLAGSDERAARRFIAAFMVVDGLMLSVLREGRPAPSRADIEALLESIEP